MNLSNSKNTDKIYLKNIINKITELDVKEKINVLNFCNNNNIPFSKNTNGYFFNFTECKYSVIYELNKLVNIIEINKQKIKEVDLQRIKKEEELKILLKKQEFEIQNNINTQQLNKLIIKPDSIFLKINPIYNIRNLHKLNTFTEQEWNNKMKEIDLKMKRNIRGNYNIAKTSSAYQRILKIIKSKKKQYSTQEKEVSEDVKLDIEDENENDLGENLEETLENKDAELDEELDDEIKDVEELDEENDEENESETIEQEDKEDKEDKEDEEEYEQDPNYYDEPNELETKSILKLDIRNIKAKLKAKGFIFNEDNDCILKIEELIK